MAQYEYYGAIGWRILCEEEEPLCSLNTMAKTNVSKAWPGPKPTPPPHEKWPPPYGRTGSLVGRVIISPGGPKVTHAVLMPTAEGPCFVSEFLVHC